MTSGFSTWGDAASATTALLALLISFLSFRNSQRALRISEAQEQRRLPFIKTRLHESYRTKNTISGETIFAFKIALTNGSDTSNSIAEIEFGLTYIKARGIPIKLRVGQSASTNQDIAGREELALQIPICVDAHQTISGWCYFCIDLNELEDFQPERYVVIVTDSHGKESTVEPIVITNRG
jgi:hypothetical protein